MKEINVSNEVSTIVSFIKDLQNMSDNLESVGNEKLEDLKSNIDKIKWKSFDLFKISQNVSLKVLKEIENRCEHEYFPDRAMCDPCKTYMICKKCGNSQ